MDMLTEEEKSLLDMYNLQKKRHAASQAKYRSSIGKERIKQYNKLYYDRKRALIEPILQKVHVPTQIDVKELAKEPVPVSKRTRRGKQRSKVDADTIKPMYETRKEPLAQITINNYLSKADLLQRFFVDKKLTLELKNELKKLLNDNPNLNEKLILDEMPYINNNIEPTIEKLREKYQNDNSFKGYLLTLTVIASHLKSLNKNVHQTLSKTSIFINKAIQDKRKKNAIEEGEEEKIIDVTRDVVIAKMNKLSSMQDKLIFALYTLFPARRLDYRIMKVTTDNKPKDDDYNYLILGKHKKFVFNNYKTRNTYGQQIFDVDDPILNGTIDKYIEDANIKNGEYLIPLQRDHREPIHSSIFSTKVSNIFKKAYGFPISVRFLRMSHSSHLHKTNPSVEKMEELATKMAHSPNEQLLYKKV